MNEINIRNEVAILVDAYKRLDKVKGAEKDSLQIVAEVSAVKLVTQVLVDINRVANTLEALEQIQAGRA